MDGMMTSSGNAGQAGNGCASAAAGSPARRPAWRRAMCRPTWWCCRATWRTISCALPRPIPKPCPVLAVSEAGDPHLPTLGAELDIRTDLPRYRVWRNGELVDEPTDVRDVWRDDLVSFAIGCSFSFEEALMEDGIEIRHIARNVNVPMYRTNVPCVSAGIFHGPLVVSMRPLKPAAAIRAVQITSRFPSVHGAPVHIGLPQLIGIEDIAQAGLWRCRAGRRRRAAGVLGLRRDPAGGDRPGSAGVLHHPRAGQHAGHRSAQRAPGGFVRPAQAEFDRRIACTSSWPAPAGQSTPLRRCRP